MKKFLVLVALLPLALSCSNDDSTPAPFFNLAEGNMWIYRRYNSDGQGQNPMPTNEIDTVRIVGQEVIDGISYFKFTHTLDTPSYDLRVDAEGHLVNTVGHVVHPGTDTDYTATTFFDPYGTNTYALGQPDIVEIEGTAYNILPYEGYFKPSEGYNLPEGVGDIRAYTAGIGFVIQRSRYLSSLAYFEYRLEHFELN